MATELRDDRGQEFPRVDERLVGRQARFGYCVKFAEGVEHGGLTRHDLATGESVSYDHGPGRSTMETVFVPAAPGCRRRPTAG